MLAVQRRMEQEADYDLYDALDLERDASAEAVRTAFRDLSRTYHPDKQQGSAARGGASASSDSGGAEAAFRRVHRAYRVLGDEDLRAFYDRYGHAGVRLAEELPDDEVPARRSNGNALSLKEDRLQQLEQRVRSLMQKREELRIQRLLALSGTFTLAIAAAPGPSGARLRRRCRLQYCSTSHAVQIAASERLNVTVGCTSHVQSTHGMGVAKLLLAAALQLGPLTTLRTSLGVPCGPAPLPELDVSLVRSVSDHLRVRQRAQWSTDGRTLSLGMMPWLSRTLQGSLAVSCGDSPGCSLGLLKRSSASGHSCRVSLDLQPGVGDLAVQLKYKPSQGFSVKVAPSVSQRGWALLVTCTKVVDTQGLTKLYWVLRVRRRSLLVRLGIRRSGLRFSLPLELWPEAAGPLPLQEAALLATFWVVPPVALRLLRLGLLHYFRWPRARSRVAGGDGGKETGEPCAAEEATAAAGEQQAEAAAAAAAAEQRRLVEREATRRRVAEAASQGLEIVWAKYGDLSLAVKEGPAELGVIDVTGCLMAKVRESRLLISDRPKSALLGFCVPPPRPLPASAGGVTAQSCQLRARVLHVVYRFGGAIHARTFGDTEAVVLP